MKLRLMRGGFMVLPLLMAVSAFAQSGAKHAMTFDDLIKMHRISGADISHNGKWVAYAVSTPDLDANRGVGSIWIASTDGSKSVQLTKVERIIPRCGRRMAGRWDFYPHATEARRCTCFRWKVANQES